MLYIVPSRERPHKIVDLIAAWDETREGDTELFVAVDDDDPKLDAYRKILRDAPPWVSWRIAPRMRMIGTLNHWATKLSHKYEVIGFMGDDHRPRTPAWDITVKNFVLLGGKSVVYGNDLLQGVNLPTQVALPARWVEALGWMAPPALTHLFADTFWKSLGAELERITYLPDVIIEHMHPIAGKAVWDDVYVEVNSGEMYTGDAGAWMRFERDGQLAAAVERVRGVL